MRLKYLFEELIEKRIGRELWDSVLMIKEKALVEKPRPGEKGNEWSLAPMLAFQAESIGEILSHHPVLAWEHKINGIRLLAVKKDGEMRLYTHRGRDVTGRYGEIAEASAGVESQRKGPRFGESHHQRG